MNFISSKLLQQGYHLPRRFISSGTFEASKPFNFIDGQRCEATDKSSVIQIEEPATGNDIFRKYHFIFNFL